MKPFCLFTLLSLSTLVLAQTNNPLPIFTEPAPDPAAKEIAFVSGGDIWTVPIGGGEARLLIAHEGFESRPLFSPDGESLAFTSTRSGNGDVYIFDFSSGNARRITFEDTFEEVSGWSPDSKFIYFSSTANDISGMNDVYRVSRSGGTPMSVLDEGYTNEFFAASSPDGKSLAYNARGIASRQWWRNGHSHIDESEIWLRLADGTSRQVTKRGAKELWPMWSKDAQTLFFVSDRSGRENLWKTSLNGSAEQLTKFQDGRVVWPSISMDGNTIVFERNFSIWKYDVPSGKAEQVNITKRGLASTPAPEHLSLNNQFQEMALSADGKKVAFVVRGEVFATSAKDGGNAQRISNTVEEESTPIWSPNSKLLVYVSESKGSSDLMQYDFTARTTKALTSGPDNDFDPVFSNDGKFIAFARNGRELRILDLSTGKDRFVCKMLSRLGPFSASNAIQWSGDNQWIAFTSFGNNVLKNVHVVNVKTGAVQQVSFLRNTFSGSVVWGKNGKYILLNTWQRTENGQVARVDLIPNTPYFPEARFEELFTDPTEVKPALPATSTKNMQPKDTLSEKKNTPVQIDFKNIHQRMSLLPVGIDAADITISHDGNTMLFIGTVAGQQNLYTFSLDESAKEPPVAKQITTTAGAKSAAQFTADDKEIMFLEQGKIVRVTIESRLAKPLEVTAEMDMIFSNYKAAVGEQAWQIQRDYFYDSAFHGADWQAIRGRYSPYIAGSQTPEELRRVIGFMLGELNASHSGISGLPNTEVVAAGKLGLKFDREEYERSGKLKIKSIIDLSPASVVGSVKPGDFVVAVDDTLIKTNMNIDQLLQYKINKRISLTLNSTGNAKDNRKVFLRPVNLSTDKRLRYRHWVNQQREYVNKISNGRLGYVHMFDMSSESLNQLYVDLDADNQSREGVVIDIRNNNGGFVNGYALDVLSRQGYMTMTVRGLPSAPARTMLGQRSLESRTILVTNQHTLSDGEDFTEGYKSMKLGTVVGEPTAGWIVFTSNLPLLDGSIMRLPFIKITDNKGANMELAPRTVDIPVTRSMGESAKGIDTQLDAAVSTLLKQLDAKTGMD
jgi:tricorn protease